jgi:uncharacterized protein
MIKKLTLVALFAFLFSYLNAQTDTAYFDAGWQVTTKNKAAFFRPKPQPQGSGYMIKDYFISGALQMEGFSKSDTADLFHGLMTWYDENGKISQKAVYVDGYQEGEITVYSPDGTILAKGINKEGAPYSGSFYEAGSSFYTLTYYENGIKQKFASIASTGSSKAKAEVTFDEQGKAKEGSFYGQAGNLIGKALVDEEEKIVDGVVVSYFLYPMAVESVQKISKGNYISPAVGYYLNGKTRYFRYTDKDKNKTKEIYFDSNGRKCDSIVYKDGSPWDGKLYTFFDAYYGNASVSERAEHIAAYKNGELHGVDKEFYPNGNLKSSATYTGNILTGTRTTCDSTGKVKYSMVYKEGYPFEGSALTDENSLETYKEGVLTEETRFHPNGKVIYSKILTKGVTVYDSTGRVLSHLEYKDGEPWNGRMASYSDDMINFEEEYKNGLKTFEFSYSEGVPTEKTVYTNNEKKVTQFYHTGRPKQETKYVDDAEREITYYAINGKLLGKLQTNEAYELSGTKCVFEEDSIVQITEYQNNNIVKDKQYYKGAVLYDINYFGKSMFNDPLENKTYTCLYKEGKPFSGVEVEYDESYKTVKRISNYTNGQLHGAQISSNYNYETEKSELGRKETFIMGVKNGPEQEFYGGNLIKETVYKDGFKEGESKCYNTNGEVIATGLYRDDNPWSGKFTEYSYDYEIASETSYTDGVPDGPSNYYSDGVISKSDLYNNGTLEKSSFYENGNLKYTLIYKNGEPFEGTSQDYSGIMKYSNGILTERVVIEDDKVKSREMYDGEHSVLSTYYSNTQIKSATPYENGSKSGRATFFNMKGLILGVGQYNDDVPAVGKFFFFSNTQEDAWIELSLGKTELIATEMVEGKVVKRMKYEILSATAEEMTEAVKQFVKVLAGVFSDYDFPASY